VLSDATDTPSRQNPPPRVRLPSSHSANASSIALFVAGWLWEERTAVGWTWLTFGWSLLLVYYLSVAGGRLYSGMHSTSEQLATRLRAQS
jgi:membrane-associated phospholipid phosphatase